MKFKSDIEVQAGLKDSSGAVGTSGQVLSSTASGVSWITQSISGYVPYTGATANVNLGAYSITADSFIKIGGTADQYLKADGSVSTAMNSRVEADFVATSGQTTFVTPYEVGQIDVYYNGSKLYPNEFTATNGTSVILAQAATLGAQISIIKYVSSFTTTSIRNESTFTTTAGQTTFAVNYTPGQVDVFYNGSKLNISEFTATDGISVVLGFACAAGESIVIDSYVNQVSGASGTPNYVSKFTGAASLGDSSIYDNGTAVGIGIITPSSTLEIAKDDRANGATLSITNSANSSDWALNDIIGSVDFKMTDMSNAQKVRGQIKVINTTVGPFTYPSTNAMTFSTASVSTLYERMRITAAGYVGINTTNPGVSLEVNGLIRSIPVYNNTTATAANLVVSAGGTFERSTSSLKYKKEVRDYDKGLETLLKIRPVYYKGKAESDGDKQFAGLIAEEIHELGLTEFVQYAEDETPDALAYTHMVALLVKSIQEQNVMLQELKAEIEILKNK